jgi:hypothetical protein
METQRPGSVPANAELIELPYSEVCVHMRVAGTKMWAEPIGTAMAQLYGLDGRRFSFPITCGEAGLRYGVANESGLYGWA